MRFGRSRSPGAATSGRRPASFGMKSTLHRVFAAVALAALVSCSGSGSSSGTAAQKAFESRNAVVLPRAIGAFQFAWVRVGDTYCEYYRFKCDGDLFTKLASAMKASPDKLPSPSGSTLWGRTAGETTPNDPRWWVPAKTDRQVYHKEDYSNVAQRSVMVFWFDESLGEAFMGLDFWD